MIVMNARIVRSIRFRQLALLGLISLMLPLGCFLDRAGAGFNTISRWGGTFDVRPMYICRGEPVTASWELYPTSMERELGLEISVAWARLTGDIVTAGTPVNVFAGGGIVTHDVNMGSRTLFPDSDWAFFFDATIEGYGDLRRERRDVRVIEDGGVRFRNETFRFGCEAGDSGGPGWSKVIYERGQLASASIQIMRLRNLSHETILLSVMRERDEEMLPPTMVTDLISPGGESDVFNGEYYGVWSAVPVSFSASIGRTICDTPPTEPILGLPPAMTPEDRVEEIQIEVMFGCGFAVPGGDSATDDATDSETDETTDSATDEAAEGSETPLDDPTDGGTDDDADGGTDDLPSGSPAPPMDDDPTNGNTAPPDGNNNTVNDGADDDPNGGTK